MKYEVCNCIPVILFQDKSPYVRERERSHDREGRDKQYPFVYKHL